MVIRALYSANISSYCCCRRLGLLPCWIRVGVPEPGNNSSPDHISALDGLRAQSVAPFTIPHSPLATLTHPFASCNSIFNATHSHTHTCTYVSRVLWHINCPAGRKASGKRQAASGICKWHLASGLGKDISTETGDQQLESACENPNTFCVCIGVWPCRLDAACRKKHTRTHRAGKRQRRRQQ